MTDEHRADTGGRLERWAGYLVFWLAGILPHGIRYTRSPHIPSTGPVLLVANHLATTETTALGRLVVGHRRVPRFLMTSEIFDWPILGRLATRMRQIPVQRGGLAAAAALDTAAAHLRNGEVVVLYPEGRLTRQPDLRPGAARSGAARLALRCPQAPVVPVGQWGPRPGWRSALRRRIVRYSIGPPIDLARWRGRTDPAAVREVTAAIMAAIITEVQRARGAPFDQPATG